MDSAASALAVGRAERLVEEEALERWLEWRNMSDMQRIVELLDKAKIPYHIDRERSSIVVNNEVLIGFDKHSGTLLEVTKV